MDCAVCGEEITGKPVWVVFGDKHQGRVQTPWPLHGKCFPKDGKVTVAEWVEGENGEPELREFETQRYVKVKGPKEVTV